eukprot:m.100047 g.100047  ORF g.100047 m.100047 type:complete len:88 (-) comp16773_c0_seq2:1388-1651(-)
MRDTDGVPHRDVDVGDAKHGGGIEIGDSACGDVLLKIGDAAKCRDDGEDMRKCVLGGVDNGPNGGDDRNSAALLAADELLLLDNAAA